MHFLIRAIRAIRAIRGSLPGGGASISKSLTCRTSLMQVVDFHDISRYFSHVLMFGERDRPGRCGVRPAPRSGGKENTRDVFGETPNTAVETTALPTDLISEHSRLFASIRGYKRIALRKSLISTIVSDSSNGARAKLGCKLNIDIYATGLHVSRPFTASP